MTPDSPTSSTSPTATRRGVLVLSGAVVGSAVAASAVAAPATRDGSVPTWESVHGFALGSRKATVAEVDRYVRVLAAASPRVTQRTIGHSLEGRRIQRVVVTSPRNHARLPALVGRLRQLRDRPTTYVAAERAVALMPAFVVAVANAHGNEPSGTDALVRTLYDLASGTDATTRRRLDAAVVVMSPIQNPDGRESGGRPNAMGFDLNRDWFSMTQPETPPRVALYRDFPAVVGLDLHEQFFQGADAYFFPPNADPVHREVSRAGLRAANDVLAPAIAKRFDREGWAYSHYGIYDLFAPIYGDSVPNQAFGAAGFLMEVANEEQYADRVTKVHAAMDAALSAVAANRLPLMRAWARQWVTAVAEGRRGTLRANLTQDPASPAPDRAPTDRVYGYVVQTRSRAADVALLVRRLLAYGVQVHVTTRPVTIDRLRPFGTCGFARTTVPTGSLLISAAQPMKSWVHLMLADEPDAPLAYFYDVSGWANGPLMRLSGGAVGSPVVPLVEGDRAAARRVRTLADLQPAPRRRTTAAGYGFAVDSAMAQSAVFELLRHDVEVRRTTQAVGSLPAGAAVVPESAYGRLRELAGRRAIPVTALGTVPTSRSHALRLPRVAVVRDVVSDALEPLFARSSGYAEWLLGVRFGLETATVYANSVDLGVLTLAELGGEAFDAVVVPDGFSTVLPGDYPNLNLSLPGAGMTPLGLAQLSLFVQGGGTYIGWGQQGIQTAMLAGIAGDLRMEVPLTGLDVPGSPFTARVGGSDPATLALRGASTVFNFRDPLLRGGRAIVAYADDVHSFGYADGVERLAGTVAASGLVVGSGRSYVCAFDPAFRGWCEATQALVGNMLLAPPPAASEPVTAAGLPGLDALAALSRAGRSSRATTLRVAAADVTRLRTAAAGLADAPSYTVGTRSDGTVELVAPTTRGLAGHPPHWLRQLLEALQRDGVRVLSLVG